MKKEVYVVDPYKDILLLHDGPKTTIKIKNLIGLKNILVFKKELSSSSSHQLLLGSICVPELVSVQTDCTNVAKAIVLGCSL